MRRTVVRFAEHHHGLVTRQTVGADEGVSALRRLRRQRAIRPVRRGVFAVEGAPRTWEQGLAAVVLAVPGSLGSHDAALRLLGARTGETRYELTTDRRKRARPRGVVVHRSACLLPEDRWVRCGIPCTSPARTVVDMSARLSEDALGRLVDDLVRRRLLRLRDLARTVGRLPSGPGRRTGAVQAVLTARLRGYQPGDSALEALVIRALDRAGLPAPTAQHRVGVAGRRYRVDLAYPSEMVAIEIDSWAYHRWRSAFDGDRARRNDLTILGYRVVQVTDGMAEGDIVATVRRVLAAAAGRPGG